MADLRPCFYSKCLRPRGGRLTLETQAGYTSTDSRNKKEVGSRVGFLHRQMDLRGGWNNGICWIKMRRGEGRRLMRRVIVHYPCAHPRLTRLCVTSDAIDDIPTITLVARRMQYAKLLFRSCFPCTQFITFISFVARRFFVESQCLLFCFNLSNVIP